jgi:4-hydroxythreonine-4-phosphate dehydrogenase
MHAARRSPTLVFTQGDPAGIGPELLLRLFASEGDAAPADAPASAASAPVSERLPSFEAIVVAERAVLERYAWLVPGLAVDYRFRLVDPVGRPRTVQPGLPGRADAAGAVAALERGVELMSSGAGDALITLPVNKAEIARHVDARFLGHTEWLAARAGLERYGRDYLMTFVAPELQVALLSTHLSLRDAIAAVSGDAIFDALRCLGRHAGGRIAVAGLNPHAGEQGLLGDEDESIVRPAIERARAEGIDAAGPFAPDSLFARARRGEFDWVLALYHDQGLIAVKTAAFGAATNWTLGLPWIRTSVDHGTAYDLAGSGRADVEPLRQVVATTLRLLAGELPARVFRAPVDPLS